MSLSSTGPREAAANRLSELATQAGQFISENNQEELARLLRREIGDNLPRELRDYTTYVRQKFNDLGILSFRDLSPPGYETEGNGLYVFLRIAADKFEAALSLFSAYKNRQPSTVTRLDELKEWSDVFDKYFGSLSTMYYVLLYILQSQSLSVDIPRGEQPKRVIEWREVYMASDKGISRSLETFFDIFAAVAAAQIQPSNAVDPRGYVGAAGVINLVAFLCALYGNEIEQSVSTVGSAAIKTVIVNVKSISNQTNPSLNDLIDAHFELLERDDVYASALDFLSLQFQATMALDSAPQEEQDTNRAKQNLIASRFAFSLVDFDMNAEGFSKSGSKYGEVMNKWVAELRKNAELFNLSTEIEQQKTKLSLFPTCDNRISLALEQTKLYAFFDMISTNATWWSPQCSAEETIESNYRKLSQQLESLKSSSEPSVAVLQKYVGIRDKALRNILYLSDLVKSFSDEISRLPRRITLRQYYIDKLNELRGGDALTDLSELVEYAKTQAIDESNYRAQDYKWILTQVERDRINELEWRDQIPEEDNIKRLLTLFSGCVNVLFDSLSGVDESMEKQSQLPTTEKDTIVQSFVGPFRISMNEFFTRIAELFYTCLIVYAPTGFDRVTLFLSEGAIKRAEDEPVYRKLLVASSASSPTSTLFVSPYIRLFCDSYRSAVQSILSEPSLVSNPGTASMAVCAMFAALTTASKRLPSITGSSILQYGTAIIESIEVKTPIIAQMIETQRANVRNPDYQSVLQFFVDENFREILIQSVERTSSLVVSFYFEEPPYSDTISFLVRMFVRDKQQEEQSRTPLSLTFPTRYLPVNSYLEGSEVNLIDAGFLLGLWGENLTYYQVKAIKRYQDEKKEQKQLLRTLYLQLLGKKNRETIPDFLPIPKFLSSAQGQKYVESIETFLRQIAPLGSESLRIIEEQLRSALQADAPSEPRELENKVRMSKLFERLDEDALNDPIYLDALNESAAAILTKIARVDIAGEPRLEGALENYEYTPAELVAIAEPYTAEFPQSLALQRALSNPSSSFDRSLIPQSDQQILSDYSPESIVEKLHEKYGSSLRNFADKMRQIRTLYPESRVNPLLGSPFADIPTIQEALSQQQLTERRLRTEALKTGQKGKVAAKPIGPIGKRSASEIFPIVPIGKRSASVFVAEVEAGLRRPEVSCKLSTFSAIQTRVNEQVRPDSATLDNPFVCSQCTAMNPIGSEQCQRTNCVIWPYCKWHLQSICGLRVGIRTSSSAGAAGSGAGAAGSGSSSEQLLGLFTTKDIPMGSFITWFSGDLLTAEKLKQRYQGREKQGGPYEPRRKNLNEYVDPFFTDSTVGRYIEQSSTPNAKFAFVDPVSVSTFGNENEGLRVGIIQVVATRQINSGEQITVNFDAADRELQQAAAALPRKGRKGAVGPRS